METSLQIVQIIATIASAILLVVLTYFTAAAARQAVTAAIEAGSAARSLRTDLSTSLRETTTRLGELTTISRSTHTLVNSNYGASLKATLFALENVLRLTTDPKELGAAQAAVDEAQKLYDAHMAAQAEVDARTSGSPAKPENEAASPSSGT